MRRSVAAAGSALFFLLAPGSVALLVPWALTRFDVREPLPYWLLLRVAGVLPLAAGAVVLVNSFVRFVVDGLGTPAPVAPPTRLVISGLYRYVRNPMYVALCAVVLGEALVLGRPILLIYGVALWAVFAAFVRWYEEPGLRRRFGAEYDAYVRAVPAWLPCLRPWTPA